MRLKLTIVIVNWNSGQQLIACLSSIAVSVARSYQINKVAVVDNGSADFSLDSLPTYPFAFGITRNQNNLGFAAACNQGAQGSDADYLLFLNPDVRIFPDTIEQTIAFLEWPANSRVGICGVALDDETGTRHRSCARFPRAADFFYKVTGLDHLFPKFFRPFVMEDWDHRTSRPVDHVIGAFYMVRRVVYEALGGFDEDFFVYLEDLDFSLRLKQAGWGSYYLAEASSFHEGGGASAQAKARRIFYSLRSRLVYSFKHFSKPAAVLLVLTTLFIEPLARAADLLRRRAGWRDWQHVIQAFILLWGFIFFGDRRSQ